MIINIEKLIKYDFSQHSELQNKKNSWIEPDYLDKKLLHYTRPHSDEYHTSFGVPFYLFHIKKLEWLNLFPAFFIRDGLISIAHFFYRFPMPKGINSVLILPKEAEALIPESWINNCLIYETYSYKRERKNKITTTYITGSVAKRNYELSSIINKLKEIKTESIKALLFDNVELGKEFVTDSNFHNLELYKELFKVFGNRISFQNWNETKDSNLNNSDFFEIEENKLNHSDSFVSFTFLSGGSTPVNKDRFFEADFDKSCVRLSKYHFIKLSKAEGSEKSKNLWLDITKLKDFVLHGEKNIVRTYNNFTKVHLCTSEFESIIENAIKR